MFDGKTYQAEKDQPRLSTHLSKVRDLMSDGEWRTLSQIQAIVGGSEAGISARLRDLRKHRFGSFMVKRRRLGDPTKGVWQYKIFGLSYPYIIEPNGQAAFL